MRSRIGVLVMVLSIVSVGCGDRGSDGAASPDPATPDPAAADAATDEPDTATDGAAPIESTGADTERDLIRPGDPSAFGCLVDRGTGPGEFYDKVADELVFPEETHYFEGRYLDGATVEIRVHPDLGPAAAARTQALRVAEPIGLLPVELRAGIGRVGIVDGDATAQADGGGEGIHLYAQNIERRLSTNRLEETIFHESVHTSLDDALATSAEWRDAQVADGEFLTAYAEAQTEREDLAESALYAWALLHHPERISDADAEAWRTLIPNRIRVIESALSAPGVYDAVPLDAAACPD